MIQEMGPLLTAMITPFNSEGNINYEEVGNIATHLVKTGTDTIVVAGTTGESPTLSHEEERQLFLELVRAKGSAKIMAGTGSNCTKTAIKETQEAESIGVDFSLQVVPYYNKPTQEGLYQHYKSINDNTSLPIIIYNIPSRCVIDMSVETMARLFELKNIAGVKDATGDLNRLDQTLEKLGPEFIQLTGEDGLAFEFNKRGGVGIISVTANIAPKLCSDMQRLSKSKNKEEIQKAEKIDKILQPLHKALFIESNPAPVKYAAKVLGLCSDEIRLPLVNIKDQTKKQVDSALAHAKLID